MQKVKRKGEDGNSLSAKKKKISFGKNEIDESSNIKKSVANNKFKKTNNKPKEGKKLDKNKDNKEGKNDPSKGKKHVENKKKPFISKAKVNNYKGKKPNVSSGKEQALTEKPKWMEMKKEKKELRIVRKKAKITPEIFEISHKAKMLSTQIQKKTVKDDFKANACKELHSLLKGNYKNIALTHDLSRVIQVLLKHSAENIKTEITEELLDLMVPMVQSKYAHHSVKRILKYGTDFIRHEVIKKFLGNILSLSTHSVSAPVLDYAYGEFATPKEKIHMQQEFYGDIYKNSKDNTVKTLTDTYKNSPELKSAILSSCKANIQKILDKNLHDGELFHSVLYDYIRECNSEDKIELISALSPLIVPLSNSLPGVNAASICVWQGTNKDKKTILKVVKEHAVSLSKHKTGYRLLLAIFDSVDDTVLVKKAIVSNLVSSLGDIAKDHWGRMTIHWLVKPNDTAAFHPNLIKFLKEGAQSGTSKKDENIRVAELREGVLSALKTEIKSNPVFWLSDPAIALLTTAILSIESTQEILNELANSICRSDWQISKNGQESMAIEDAGMHMCLKKMAALDKDRSDCSLGDSISECINNETLKVWLPTNRGCFFLLKLIESNKEDTAKKLIMKIKPEVDILRNQSTQGAKLLLQKIEKL